MDAPGADTPLYSVAAVARHTGVPAVTLRAWERRYGFPRPRRASGGRRLYTQRDIWTVRALRTPDRPGRAHQPRDRRAARRRLAARSPADDAPSIDDEAPLGDTRRRSFWRRCSIWPPAAPSRCCRRRSACCRSRTCVSGLIQPALERDWPPLAQRRSVGGPGALRDRA